MRGFGRMLYLGRRRRHYLGRLKNKTTLVVVPPSMMDSTSTSCQPSSPRLLIFRARSGEPVTVFPSFSSAGCCQKLAK